MTVYPILYDGSLPSYKDNLERNLAWQAVAAVVGVSNHV